MLKKISIMTAVTLLMSSFAFAAGSSSPTLDMSLVAGSSGLSLYGAKGAASATSPLIGKNSTGVGVGVTTGAQGYALITQHINGTKAFGSTFDSTAMVSADVTTKGTPLMVKPATSDIATAFSTGSWTSM
jgi:hypothetical protein